MRSFLNSSLQLVATAETVSSPINSGVMLLKPSQYVYERGLQAHSTHQHSSACS